MTGIFRRFASRQIISFTGQEAIFYGSGSALMNAQRNDELSIATRELADVKQKIGKVKQLGYPEPAAPIIGDLSRFAVTTL